MRTRDGHSYRKRPEAESFRLSLMRLRGQQGWTQDTLAQKLGVSRRTISNWENGYWLPPFKERVHVVLALGDAPPEWVLEIADALGVSVNPAVEPLLARFHAALEEPTGVAPPAPPRPRPSPGELRALADGLVRDAADAMDARANDLRAAIVRVLAACGARGATLEDALEAVRPLKKPRDEPA